MIEFDRRSFLQAILGGAGAVVIGSCAKSSSDQAKPSRMLHAPPTTVPLVAPDQLPPSPRPTVRLAGRYFGPFAPFSYLPPTYGLVALVYDTLVATDVTGALQPWLAASPPQVSSDGVVHTFQLRDNARWHDGQPVTSEDVAFSFEYFKEQRADGKIPLWVIFPPDNVEAVRALGENKVEIRLDSPVVTFTENVARRFPIVPRHVWSKVDAAREAEHMPELLVGSGPYRVGKGAFKSRGYLFEANDDFFFGKPFVKRVEIKDVGDPLAALRAGEVDASGFDAQGTNAKVLGIFRDDPSFGVLDGPPDFTIGLYWNLAKGGALADPRFRRACAHAIDRQDAVRRLLGGGGVAGNPGFLVPGHPYQVDVEQYPFSLAAANALLDDAGYRRGGGNGIRRGPDGKPLRFKLTTPPTIVSAVEFVVNALERVGVGLQVEPSDDIFAGGAGYEMAMLLYGGMNEDPDYMRRIYSSRVSKLFMAAQGYVNREFDDLADRQLVTADDGERKQIVGRMQELVATDLPLLHLYYPNSYLIFKKKVFDQLTITRHGGGFSKDVLVTGVSTGGTAIRSIAE